jgi:hypothetical protein
MKRYRFAVEVEAENHDAAVRALSERLDYEEDYGFDYSILEWRSLGAGQAVIEGAGLTPDDASQVVTLGTAVERSRETS